MKKAVLLFSILLLSAVSAVLLQREGAGGLQAVGEGKYNKIKERMQPAKIGAFLLFDEEALPFDAASHTFYLPLDMEKEAWESGVFSVACADGASAQNAADGSVSGPFFSEDFRTFDKAEVIAAQRAFSFLVVRQDVYEEYFLVFTGLPMMTFEESGYAADDGTMLWKLRLYDTDHEGDWVTDCYTRTRLRGNTSLNYEKKSLRLYLKKQDRDGNFTKCKKNLLGLRDDDDWILNSLYGDESRVRDKLCIDLWNEVGAQNNPYGQNYGTQAELLEVMISGAYQGMYALMVPVDAKQLGMKAVSAQIAGGEAFPERIYKKKYTADWSSADFSGALPDPAMPDYRGGFYLKGDTVLGTVEEWRPLYDIAALLEADDAAFASGITDIADRQNLVDNWLFYQAVGGFDNENKNVYYVAKNRGGAYYGYFIPWDLNISFGLVYADNKYFCERKDDAVSEWVLWQPGQRMLETDADGAKALLADTWQDWRKGAFSDQELQARIADLEHTVKDSGAFAREAARWQGGNCQADFSYLYAFAAERMKRLDAYVADMSR